MERWRRTEGVFTLYIPIYLTRKPLHKWEFTPSPLCHAAAPSSFIRMLQLTQEARLLILFNNSDHKSQKKANALPSLAASSPDSQQPGRGASGTIEGFDAQRGGQ